MLMKNLLLLVLSLACISLATAQDKPMPGFSDRVFKDKDGNEAKWVLFTPHGYQGDKAYPLIVFLHGSGETGTDGVKQVKVGLGPAILKQENAVIDHGVVKQKIGQAVHHSSMLCDLHCFTSILLA